MACSREEPPASRERRKTSSCTMRAALLAVLVVLCAAGASGHRYPEGYPCGVCQTALEALEARPQQPLAEIASDLQASDFLATNLARGGWTMGNLSAAAVARLGGVRPACGVLGFCQPQVVVGVGEDPR